VVKESLKPFQYEVPLRFSGMYSGQSHKIEEDRLDQGQDCIVSTFERLQLRRDRQRLFLSHINTLVIDEFDTMVDSGLEERVRLLLD
jgi:superfamily II DNA/RNA helicase